jgi:hypothetical protein
MMTKMKMVAGRSTKITATACGIAPKTRTTTTRSTPTLPSWAKAMMPTMRKRRKISSAVALREEEGAGRKDQGSDRNHRWRAEG